MTLVIVVFGLGLYLLPTFIAGGRRCKSAAGIVILDLLLGWTILGWVGALIWAAIGETRPAPAAAQASEPMPAWKIGLCIAACFLFIAVIILDVRHNAPRPAPCRACAALSTANGSVLPVAEPVAESVKSAPLNRSAAHSSRVAKSAIDACAKFAGTWKQQACEVRLAPEAAVDPDCAKDHDPHSPAYRQCVADTLD